LPFALCPLPNVQSYISQLFFRSPPQN